MNPMTDLLEVTELGKALRALRKMHELTLADVAERASTAVSYLSDLETGRTRPSWDMLVNILKVFDCSVLLKFQSSDDVIHWHSDPVLRMAEAAQREDWPLALSMLVEAMRQAKKRRHE